jgi:heptosyltransferase-1
MKRSRLKKSPAKLLIIKPSSLGDVVHSLPFLNVVHESFPEAEIHWVISKGLEGLLENNPMVHKLWVINKHQWKEITKIRGTITEWMSLLLFLRDESYDIAVDLQGLLRSGILTAASKAPIRLGFRDAREGSRLFYTDMVEGERESEVHAVDRYLKVASALGCDVQTVAFPMHVAKESQKVMQLKRDIGEYAVIAPGTRWKTKQWPADRFGRLSSMFRMRSIIIGSKADRALAEEAVSCSGGKAISMAGKTDIKDMIALVRDAKFVVTNDSGPMHIGAACGVPVVALFGPTNPSRTGPYGSGHIIIKAASSCAPCYKRRCKDVFCMHSISVDEVCENKL